MTEGGSSIPAVQTLLAALAASKPAGRFAEMGTAFGAGALAIAETMGPGASFVTVEVDPERCGILVKDDLTPGRATAGDPVREVLLHDPRLSSVEIQTTPHAAAILAVRRAGLSARTR